jgi:hypothetical protein
MDLFEKGFFGLFLERRNLIDKIVDPFPVFKEDKGKERHEKNIQEDEKNVFGESPRLGRGKVSECLCGSEKPGGQTAFHGLGREDVSLNVLKPWKSPDLFDQLFQLPVADINIGPLGKFNELFGHVDKDQNKRRDGDEKYYDRHQKCDQIIPFWERFSQSCIKRVKCERENRCPENGREEWREDIKDLVNNESQNSDEEKRDKLFAFHGFSLADFFVLASKTLIFYDRRGHMVSTRRHGG